MMFGVQRYLMSFVVIAMVQIHVVLYFLGVSEEMMDVAMVGVSTGSETDFIPSLPSIWPAASVAEFYTVQEATVCAWQPQHFTVLDSSLKQLRSEDDRMLVQAAMERFRIIVNRTIPAKGLEFPINPQEQTILPIEGIHVRINQKANDKTKKTPPSVENMDEFYRLEVTTATKVKTERTFFFRKELQRQDQCIVTLSANSVVGILRSLQSLWQLLEFGWYEYDQQETAAPPAAVFLVHNAPIRIIDEPVYSFRGLLIDTARHYLPVSFILQQLDALEWNKLNVLHWHMTDTESWPFQSKTFPELAEKGAFCETCIYTPDDVRMIVEQARLRGIRVIVEFDMPGHNQAMAASHPELMTECDGKPQQPLNVTNDAVYDFLQRLYEEITQLWPDPWIFIGGDEVDVTCWRNSTQISEWMRANRISRVGKLQARFESKQIKMVSERFHKRSMVWQEAFDQQTKADPLPKDVIVDAWMSYGTETLNSAVQQGYDTVYSAMWYLDNDRHWTAYYDSDPRSALTEENYENRFRVLGGKASMWGERVNATNFNQRVWPRTCAVAEKLWTGMLNAANDTRTERLELFRSRMVQQGIPASTLRYFNLFR